MEHEAYNASTENRFHFIMHGGFNKERKELMTKSLVKQFGKDVLKEIEDVGSFGQVDELSRF